MKAKKIISILLSVFMLLTPLFTIPAQAAQTDYVASLSSIQAYQNFLDELMIEYNISGVAYVTQNGRVLCQSAVGMQNTIENKPMTIDTLFPVGSISKQFCATAILLLQEQGKLSVNDTLDQYFPEYVIGKDITIKNLLTMRSGIRDYVNIDNQYKGHENPVEEYTLSDTASKEENHKAILDWLFTQNLKFTPDRAYSYSNSNYLLLSIIVEQVSCINYTDFIKQNIFSPLNMTNSGFYEELVDSPDLAEHHVPDELKHLMDPTFKGLSQGAGDLVSNSKDMDKWMTSLADGKLLSEESFKEMTTPQTPDSNYVYGIIADLKNGSLSHTGAVATYLSVMFTCPEQKLNIFVITNDAETLVYDILYAAQDIADISIKGSMLGDIDGDGKVTILDATAIQMHLAEIATLFKEQIECGDTDGDGKLTVLDATEIQFFLAEL
ncbi:MAG: hypothetical protein E7513_05660 [Ruminococcaceae bacterium]|nr:hypothetical protein [Oscillospiraceae bacterium]